MKLPLCPAKDALAESVLCRSNDSKERYLPVAIIQKHTVVKSDSNITLVKKQRGEVARGTVGYANLRTLLPL